MSRSRSGSLAGSPRPWPGASAGSVYGGAGGSEPRASGSRLQALLPGLRAHLDSLGAGSQQEALQGLNERLAGYLQRVRGLEAANRALEEEIAQVRARRGGAGQRDWEACERPLGELRKQVGPSGGRLELADPGGALGTVLPHPWAGQGPCCCGSPEEWDKGAVPCPLPRHPFLNLRKRAEGAGLLLAPHQVCAGCLTPSLG